MQLQDDYYVSESIALPQDDPEPICPQDPEPTREECDAYAKWSRRHDRWVLARFSSETPAPAEHDGLSRLRELYRRAWGTLSCILLLLAGCVAWFALTPLRGEPRP